MFVGLPPPQVFPSSALGGMKLPRPKVAHYSGESGGEGSDGKGREKNVNSCEILCRIFAKSVENVKIGSYTEDGGFF